MQAAEPQPRWKDKFHHKGHEEHEGFLGGLETRPYIFVVREHF